MSNQDEIWVAFKCAIAGYVYANVLTDKGQLLNPLWKFLDERIGKYPFLFKPIIDCFKCVTGQLTLWYYVIMSLAFHKFLFLPLELIYLICLSIFISLILNFIYGRVKDN